MADVPHNDDRIGLHPHRWPDSRPGSCASIAQFLVTGFAVQHSQFSDKLHFLFDTSLGEKLCTQACMSDKEFVGMESFAVPP
jgi:hypothetical protein